MNFEFFCYFHEISKLVASFVVRWLHELEWPYRT